VLEWNERRGCATSSFNHENFHLQREITRGNKGEKRTNVELGMIHELIDCIEEIPVIYRAISILISFYENFSSVLLLLNIIIASLSLANQQGSS
jgi:hypothetical protein